MKGIECAFTASLGQDVELKTSKAGKRFASFSCIVDMGMGEDGQWLRCICFGEFAEQLAGRARKGDKVYVEGALTLNHWESDGETKHGLNVTAWRAERLANIGRAKVKRAPAHERDEEAPAVKPFPIAMPAKKVARKTYARPFDDELTF